MLALGEGGPKDMAKAAQLESKACNTKILACEVDLEKRGLCMKKYGRSMIV